MLPVGIDDYQAGGVQISVIPKPANVVRLAGEHVLLPQTKIIVPDKFFDVARMLQETLLRGTGWELQMEVTNNVTDPYFCRRTILFVDAGAAAAGKSPDVPSSAEGYELRVEHNCVTIIAHEAAGAFYATRSFLQLLPPAILDRGPRVGVSWRLPCVSITDLPRFQWRGAMLDCGRHFFDIDFIKKFIDLLALHKLNRMHWHLTEDQGWRIEIQKYPELTRKGALRSETTWGHVDADCGGDNVPHGGFYSQSEIREVVDYAKRRFVQIIPEIEMPGHAHAAIASYGQYGSCQPPSAVSTKWGVHQTLFNAEEGTFSFLEDVLDEVIDLFDCPFVHIGGDEADKHQWNSCADTARRMTELGVANSEQLQSYFVRRIAKYLSSKGKRAVGWDEILEGGELDGNTVVMSWRNHASMLDAVRAGHDVVVAWRSHTYLDYYQSPITAREPLAFNEVLLLSTAYHIDPVSPELAPEYSDKVLGIQGQIWTEYISTPQQAEYMAFPRLCALAEAGWSSAERRDYSDFLQRLREHLKRLDVLLVNYRALD